ncbi:MAG: zf-TFIIB domain-containing protein [Chloroflexi bacterium]|nr:zf-TFIIB domain-containing protein [Chloroflexota bacterium]
MKCPNCATTLQMTERQGVEIDYCPSCRGVWLDRGELDKLIERAGRDWGSTSPRVRWAEERHSSWPAPTRSDDDDLRYPRRKRKSFLSELFDF